MKIALIGYGKMGKTIEEIAVQRGHQVILIIDENNQADFTKENISKADVAIEFTGPHSAYENVRKAIGFNIPVVCGSTGCLEMLDEIKKLCVEKNGAFLYASNFSIGVNIFFEINKKLASLMAAHSDYEAGITEIHHTQKKDAPSGTAITIAEQILEHIRRKKSWVNHISDNTEDLEILSERIDPSPGTHKVRYSSAIDDIEITHTAHSRKGFALGAVIAGEFINNKKGIFGMKEVLGL
jgi:4-hydroxy-tetrahydrodipicolinate reductase